MNTHSSSAQRLKAFRVGLRRVEQTITAAAAAPVVQDKRQSHQRAQKFQMARLVKGKVAETSNSQAVPHTPQTTMTRSNSQAVPHTPQTTMTRSNSQAVPHTPQTTMTRSNSQAVPHTPQTTMTRSNSQAVPHTPQTTMTRSNSQAVPHTPQTTTTSNSQADTRMIDEFQKAIGSLAVSVHREFAKLHLQLTEAIERLETIEAIQKLQQSTTTFAQQVDSPILDHAGLHTMFLEPQEQRVVYAPNLRVGLAQAAGESQLAQPVVSEPDLAQAASESDLPQPVGESDLAQAASESQLAQPVVSEPELPQPVVSEPELPQPVVSEPELPQPVVSEPEPSSTCRRV
jgi:hypothetical protein